MPVQITPAALLHFAALAVRHALTEGELTHALRTVRETRPTGAVAVATVEAAVTAALATRAAARVA